MAKLSLDQFFDFVAATVINPTLCHKQRFGQCFLNQHPQYRTDPDLFYCNDGPRAIQMIYDKYVDMELT